MINAKDLMRIHVETLFTRDDAGRLLVVNEAGGAAAPRFFLGRTADGNACWFGHDVDAAVAHDLHVLGESQPPGLEVEARLGSTAPFIARLARDAPVRRTWAGPAFRFPASLPGPGLAVRVTPDNVGVLSPYFEDWRDDVTAGAPILVVLEGRQAVALCSSVRISPLAHEAGVETHRDCRGRGYAARAVASWARTVREMDRIPLYSTSWDNEASRALAKKTRPDPVRNGPAHHVRRRCPRHRRTSGPEDGTPAARMTHDGRCSFRTVARTRAPCPVRGLARGGHSLTTFSAAGPFWPCTTSNSTLSPSDRDLKPCA